MTSKPSHKSRHRQPRSHAKWVLGACLATALCGAYQYGDPDPDWWRRAQSHIARALALDARNSYVQIWVGMAYYFAGRPAAALPFLEGAVASSRLAATW